MSEEYNEVNNENTADNAPAEEKGSLANDIFEITEFKIVGE